LPGAAGGDATRPPAPGQPPIGSVPPARLIRLSLVLYGTLTAAAFLWREAVLGRSLLLASPVDHVRWAHDAGLGLLAGVVVIAISELLSRSTRFGRELAQALAQLVGACLLLAAASGIGEEAFFRGALQPHLGLLATSILFALAHLVPRRELLPWCAFSFGAGLLLGALYAVTGNLVAPIVTHFTVNAVNLRRLARQAEEGRP
jgi:membrane protease YdiL (CAAX protease family)